MWMAPAGGIRLLLWREREKQQQQLEKKKKKCVGVWGKQSQRVICFNGIIHPCHRQKVVEASFQKKVYFFAFIWRLFLKATLHHLRFEFTPLPPFKLIFCLLIWSPYLTFSSSKTPFSLRARPKAMAPSFPNPLQDRSTFLRKTFPYNTKLEILNISFPPTESHCSNNRPVRRWGSSGAPGSTGPSWLLWGSALCLLLWETGWIPDQAAVSQQLAYY